MGKWNGNKFSVYESEEKTVLGLLDELGSQVNHNTDNFKNKTDLHGDHKGSWQGLSKPTLSEEGMRATVEDIIDNKIPSIETSLNNIATINTTLENFQGETIKVVGVHNVLKTGSISTGNPIVDIAKYSILLENLENVTIDFARDSKLIIDLNINENPSAILLKNCKNVIIKNLFVEGINHELLTEHQLTQGNGVYMVNCVNCKVVDSIFKNTVGGVYLLNSSECIIDNCLHYVRTEMQTYLPNKKSCGSFIIVQCKNCNVINSNSYGGLGDGNIFLGGGSGQNNCKVINCNVFNYTYGETSKQIYFPSAQGICVDGSNVDCIVQDCYVEGFAIGIDIKNFAHSTTVINNICVGNEIGIAFRPGDQGLNNPDIFGGRIIGNTIHPNGGNGLEQQYPPFSTLNKISEPIAIMLHETQDIIVSNNTIENMPGYNVDFFPLVIYNEKAYNADKNQQGILISNNLFNNNSSKWTIYGTNNKPCIYMRGSSNMGTISILDNHFTPLFDNSTIATQLIDIDFKCDVMKINGNTFGRIKSDTHMVLVSNVSTLSFTNNHFNYNSGVIKTSGVGNVTIQGNVISPHVWNLGVKMIEINGNSYINVSNNTYNGGSDGAENGFLNCTGENAKVVVLNNTLFFGYAQITNAFIITSTNKSLKGNVGSRAGGTLVDIT